MAMTSSMTRRGGPAVAVLTLVVITLMGAALMGVAACASQTARSQNHDAGSGAVPTCAAADISAHHDRALSGPAVTALTGGAATQSFSLDHGKLVIDRPKSSDRPTFSGNTAMCDALASSEMYGGNFGAFAQDSGVLVGYARVSVNGTKLAAESGSVGVLTDGSVAPKLPAAADYRNRLAWVLVVGSESTYNCPALRLTPTQHASTVDAYGYQIFLVDARTGKDALAYTEGGQDPCGGPGVQQPSVSVPIDDVSVPWTMVSRDPNGYAATIAVKVEPCDGYSPVLNADGDHKSRVNVLVQRPIGVACGASRSVDFQLHADVVTDSLPATLIHAPTGLMLPTAPDRVAPEASATSVLHQVSIGDCGRTFKVGVGSVIVMPPLSGNETGPYPVTSSDPGVVGPLDGQPTGPVAELRAWKAGHADLRLTKIQPDVASHLTCAMPWTVHVIVH
jgi:hypothetical protein